MNKSIKQRIGAKLIPNLPLSLENFYIFRHELNAYLLRMNTYLNPFKRSQIRKYTKQDNISLNVGAGPFGKPSGWVNIDIFQMPNISFTYDCRRKMPFRSNTVARIRCEHVFEHLTMHDEVPDFLRECKRVLKDNGVLRIVVPDVEKFIKAYYTKDEELWKEMGFEVPKDAPTPMFLLNHVFRQDGEHKFAYDYETLAYVVKKAGFKEIIRQDWGVSIDEELQSDLANHRPYSLYVDCVK